MIAVAVLVVLAALIVPTLHGASEAVEFKETCEQFSSAVSVCRSEAKRRGTPMELVTRKGSDGRVSLVGRPASLESPETEKKDGAKGGQVLLILPLGYSLDRESGVAEPGAEGSDDPTPDDTKVEEPKDKGGAPMTVKKLLGEEDEFDKPLVVFWASGGATTGSGLYMHGKNGRVVGAEINSFTGLLRMGKVADGSGG